MPALLAHTGRAARLGESPYPLEGNLWDKEGESSVEM